MPKKVTTADFITKCIDIHGDKYDYNDTIYTKAKAPVKIGCRVHGIFETSAASHLYAKTGCPRCAGVSRPTTGEYIIRAIDVHGTRYDYSKVLYKNMKSNVTIICHVHGEFEQVAEYHLAGNGCPRCVGRHRTRDEYIAMVRSKHGDRYSYDNLVLNGMDCKITLGCSEHGEFLTPAAMHLRGTGCPKCGVRKQVKKRTSDTHDFVTRAKRVHGNTYDYTNVVYVNTNNKVEIVCSVHGSFYQVAASHLAGRGCKKCSHRISKGEKEWLDHLGIAQRQIRKELSSGRVVEFDGYDPSTNTAYEYLGDYWHGNPTVFLPCKYNPQAKKLHGELHRTTLERLKEIRSNGFDVITIWEREWLRQRRRLAR